jgi:translocation and assembly module TamB
MAFKRQQQKPDRRRSRWRWVWYVAGLVAGLVFAGLILLPIWLPWVLEKVGERVGIEFDSYSRLGWTRFELRGVRGEWPGVRLRVERVEAPSLATWGWERFRGTGGVPMLRAEGWDLELSETGQEAAELPDEGLGTGQLLDGVSEWVEMLRPWARRVEAREGRVRSPWGEVRVSGLDWRDGELLVRAERVPAAERVTMDLRWRAGEWPEFQVSLEPLGLGVRARTERGVGGWRVEGDIEWQGIPGRLDMRLAQDDWLPAEVRFRAPMFRVAADRLGLDGYDFVEGTAQADWQAGRFEVRVEATANPGAATDWLRPAARGVVTLQGDGRQVLVSNLELDAPGLQARLTSPVEVDWQGRLLTGSALLQVEADLSRLGIEGLGEIEGRVEGGVELRDLDDGLLVWLVDLRGRDLGWDSQKIVSARLRAEVQGSEVRLEVFEVDLGQGSGLRLEGQGDWVARRIERLEWRLTGGWVRQFLPERWRFERVLAAGEVTGELARLEHKGQVEVEGERWSGSLSWDGSGTELDRFEADVSLFGGQSLWVEGEGRVALGELLVSVGLDAMEWRGAGGETMSLAAPVRIEWCQGDFAEPGGAGWEAVLGELRLEGDGLRVEAAGAVRWPHRGEGRVRVQGFRLGGIRGDAEQGLEAVWVDDGSLAVDWDGGPWRISGMVDGGIEWGGLGRLGVVGEFEGNERGFKLGRLEVWDGPELGVEARGSLSGAWVGAVESGLDWGVGADGVLDFVGVVSGDGAAIQSWLEVQGVRLERAMVHWRLSGEVGAPELRAVGWVGRAGWAAEAGSNLPDVEGVSLGLRWVGDRLWLEPVHGSVLGQGFEFGLALPLKLAADQGEAGWQAGLDWRSWSGQLRVPEGWVAGLGPYVPQWLAGVGRFQAGLELRPGGELEGTFEVVDEALRPMEPLASVRDIRLKVRLGDGVMSVEEGLATVGGEPVRVEGSGRWGGAAGAIQFAVRVRGTNVPVVRRAGVLLRADLDLQVAATNALLGEITGLVWVRDSLVVQDLGMLVPGESRPEVRPPYFRVESGPLAAWRLNVGLRSERGVRLVSPVLRGEVSSNVRLGGTLGDPVVVGEVRLNSGKLIFPFGALDVAFGSAALTPETAADPELLLNATGRVYGYQIQVDVTGTPRQPLIMFSSVPPLTTQEILLLLASGQSPRGGHEFSTGDRVGRLGVFVGRDILRQLGVGDVGEERVMIRSGTSISQEGRPTYEVEYRLTERVSAVGEYDRFGGINGSIKWRVYSK